MGLAALRAEHPKVKLLWVAPDNFEKVLGGIFRDGQSMKARN